MGLIGSICRLIRSKRSCNYNPLKGEAHYEEVGNPAFTRYLIDSLKKRYIAFNEL